MPFSIDEGMVLTLYKPPPSLLTLPEDSYYQQLKHAEVIISFMLTSAISLQKTYS
jgi:hypothetical protein